MVLIVLHLTVREPIHFSSQFPVGSVGGVVMVVPSLSSAPPNCPQEMFTFPPHFSLLLSVGGGVGFFLSDQLFVRDFFTLFGQQWAVIL